MGFLLKPLAGTVESKKLLSFYNGAFITVNIDEFEVQGLDYLL